MICSQAFGVNVFCYLVDVADIYTALIVNKPLSKLYKYSAQHFCVLKGSVMVKFSQTQMLCDYVQLVLFQLGKHTSAHYHRINNGKIELYPLTDTF